MRRRSSQVWIFSFADLAFLLVMALIIIPSTDKDYVQLKLSDVVKSEALQSAPGDKPQFRLYVDSEGEKWGIHLQHRGVDDVWSDVDGVDSPDVLEARLSEIKKGGLRPEFVASQGSLTGDMLMALSVLQKVWPETKIWTTVQTKLE
ncbi:hypothetical protein [Maridesulfovibrio sp.]|uniref:hypothetical protein n=1 Tax=Maridesulfovibrio sp. TaxID=2795000 RepID=UPI002A189418|nr:hypothetical protein [Maridesulfovibrio sp.]